MLEVILKGHDSYYGITDVLRLFFTGISERKEECKVICENAPDITIISELVNDQVFTYKLGEQRASSNLEPIETKRDIKRSLYAFLCSLTGESMPWGCLTGIRPTVVASEENYDADKLITKYLVREDKAKLCCETAEIENRCLQKLPGEDINIYVGVPFCPSRCEYCSFISRDVLHHLDVLDDYASAVTEEIKTVAPGLLNSRKISSIYLGGGTPTVFGDKTFAEFLESIISNLQIDLQTEFTVEAGRPDTITDYKLDAMRELGVKRICINPQTMRSETLLKLNRNHTAEDIIRIYNKARSRGFEVINMDLIAGLKYETSEDFLNSVKTLISMDPENITVHTLYKKRRSDMSLEDVLDFNKSRGELDAAVRTGYDLLREAGYIPYYMYRQKDTGHGLENVGFAKEGTECLYNVAMMTDKRDVISFGAGGMSKRIFDHGRYERCPCTKDVMSYIREPNKYAEKKIAFFEI